MQSVVSVIDDDRDMREALLELLRSSGIPAIGFPGVESFLVSAEFETTTCVISDIRMEGMSGFDLIETLEVQQKKIPVILISSYDTVAARRTAAQLNAFCLLTKPFDPQDIMNQLWLALRANE